MSYLHQHTGEGYTAISSHFGLMTCLIVYTRLSYSFSNHTMALVK